MKHRPIYRRILPGKPEWRSQSALEEEEEEGIRVMMIYRLDSTVFADDYHNALLVFSLLMSLNSRELRLMIYEYKYAPRGLLHPII